MEAVSTKWAIDPMHSEINFKVKHLMISTVTGRFTDFTATIESDEDGFENAQITFEAQVASINTGNAHRDEHLKSADFFDADNFPTLRFVSTAFKKADDDSFKLKGDFTLKGVTKSLTLKAEYNGIHKDNWGNTKAGFELTGKINRTDFGLKWNAITEAGGLTVSEDVRIECFIELVKQ